MTMSRRLILKSTTIGAASLIARPSMISAQELLPEAETYLKRDRTAGFGGETESLPDRPAAAAVLSKDDFRAVLNTIFKWDQARIYQYFLLELPGKIDFASQLGRYYQEIRDLRGGQRPFSPILGITMRDGTIPNIGISVPPSIINPNIATSDQFCISLDGFTNLKLPVAGAQIVSGAFVAGAVTRLLLELTSRQKLANLSVANYKNKVESKVENWISPRPPRPASPNPWPRGTPADPGERMPEFLARISKDGLLQTAGIFHGWAFAEALAKDPDPSYLRTVWRLLKSRFSWTEIGDLTGYTLNYIIGYLRCQAVLNASSRGGSANFEQIRQALARDEATRGAEVVASDFFDGLLSKVPTGRGRPFEDFLKGYHRGGLRSSDAVFDQALQLGYGIGYQDGFQAGYVRGYADGYSAGYSDGTSTVSGIVTGIINAVSNLETASTLIAIFI